MAERKHIGIFFTTGYDLSMGLVIYHLNIIRTLNTLDDKFKPEITIIHSDSTPINEITELNYPYINFYKYDFPIYSFINRIFNKACRLLFGKAFLIKEDASFPKNLDCLFPFHEMPETTYVKNKIYWKPDFQEKYYPEYFSKNELEYADAMVIKISQRKNTIVFSSNDTANDYKTFYPNYANEIKLLRFSSFLPEFHHIDINELTKKYSLSEKYFICPNQFWPHKNHITVLKAIKIVKKTIPTILIVFTGKQSSYRDESYFDHLKDYIMESNLEENIRLTGFLPRVEQLTLMKNALAIIQPSLFEGWSTVIEDAKAMNQFVIASALKVNQEQMNYNISFFEATNEKELAEKMCTLWLNGISKTDHDYSINLNTFKEDIIDIFKLR